MGFNESRQDITAAVKEQTDIVKIVGEHVELKRSGVRYLGLCPFHGEKTPSFSVHGAQQFYHCFGCGESGDVFSFMMKYHNMDFPQALRQLADRVGIELPKKSVSPQEKKREAERQRMYEVTRKAADIYHRFLAEDVRGRAGRKYLSERGIPEDIRARFKIGYAPSKDLAGWDFLAGRLTPDEAEIAEKVGLLVKNDRGGRYDRFRDRVLFPIYDTRGRACGFGGRIVGEGQPKYMNSPESPIYNKSRMLLGLYQQSDSIRRERQAILVEGNFDMISLVVNGCENVAAPLGTALTSSQVRLLGRYAEEAVLLFDGDEAGVKAAMRAAPLFLAEKLQARVALLPDGHDPDTFIQEKGREELQTLLAEARELPEFMLGQLIAEHGLSLEGKSKIAEELKSLAAAASSSLQRSVIISHFAEKLGLDPNQLQAMMRKESPVVRPAAAAAPAAGRSVRVRSEPLSPAQKRLVQFMILNPGFLKELEEKGLREILLGGLGEVIYLQTKMLVNSSGDAQPEDILSALPEGPERELVAAMLLSASLPGAISQVDNEGKEELKELLEWLELEKMRKLSRNLDEKIMQAQQDNNFAALEKALKEKQSVEKDMRRFRE